MIVSKEISLDSFTVRVITLNREQQVNKVVIDILIMSKSIVMYCSILCLLVRFILIYATRTDAL